MPDFDELHWAASRGDLETVKRLLVNQVNLNGFDEIGYTALHYAVKGEHIEVAKYLLDSGAEVNAHDESQIGDTPLASVAQTCSLAMAQLLIAHRADPTIPGWMQLTALHKSRERKRGDGPAVHQLLIERAKQLGYVVTD